MPYLIPLASGIAAAMTVVLANETRKSAKRKFERKRARRAKNKTASSWFRYKKRDCKDSDDSLFGCDGRNFIFYEK